MQTSPSCGRDHGTRVLGPQDHRVGAFSLDVLVHGRADAVHVGPAAGIRVGLVLVGVAGPGQAFPVEIHLPEGDRERQRFQIGLQDIRPAVERALLPAGDDRAAHQQRPRVRGRRIVPGEDVQGGFRRSGIFRLERDRLPDRVRSGMQENVHGLCRVALTKRLGQDAGFLQGLNGRIGRPRDDRRSRSARHEYRPPAKHRRAARTEENGNRCLMRPFPHAATTPILPPVVIRASPRIARDRREVRGAVGPPGRCRQAHR